MKKYILSLLFLLLFPFIVSAQGPDSIITKDQACKLKDGYYEKNLEVKYPDFIPSTREFIKKNGKLVYFVRLGLLEDSEVTSNIYVFEYNCSKKRASQIGDEIRGGNTGGPSPSIGLEGASTSWIIGTKSISGDCGKAYQDLYKIVINRKSGKQEKIDFSKFSGMEKFKKKSDGYYLGIHTFGSTNDPNVFNAVLGTYENCADLISQVRVVVDLKKKTIKLRTQSSIVNLNSYYRINNGVVQYQRYYNGTGKQEWANTKFDASSISLTSSITGKDKNGSFYAENYLYFNGAPSFAQPVSPSLSDFFYHNGETYIIDRYVNTPHTLTQLSFDINTLHSTYETDFCEMGDYQYVVAYDKDNCYGTVGNPIMWNIELIGKRRK